MTRHLLSLRFSALFSASLALLLAAGCPDGPGGPGADAGVTDGGNDTAPTVRDELDAAIAALGVCAENDPLLSIYPDLTPEGTVTGNVRIAWELPLVDADAELSLREDETRACAELLNAYADTCDLRGFNDLDSGIFETCDPDLLIQGSRPAGDDCTDNRYACQGFCKYDRDSGCSTCADVLLEGEACEGSDRCEPGTDCNSVGDEPLVCRAPSELGEACDFERDCVVGAFCSVDNVCETYRAPGDSCADDSQACEFGCSFSPGAEGVCSDPPSYTMAAEGEACAAPMGPDDPTIGCDFYAGVTCLVNDEMSGTGVCTAFDFQEPGEPCDGPWSIALSEFSWGNRLCANDLENYCHFNWSEAGPGYAGECRRRPIVGETCESAGFSGTTVPCADGLFCLEDPDADGIGACVAQAQEGEPCLENALETYDWGCAYGLSCDFEANGGPTCVPWEDIDEGQPMCMDS
jgi:hypothetical protein